jgi:hypothetical protein
MAKSKKNTSIQIGDTTTHDESEITPDTLTELPEGFRSVISARADGYFRVDEGAWIQGVIVGRYPKKDDPGFYYQLRLTRPCLTVQKRDDDGQYYNTNAAVGELISIDERASMEGLAPAADDPNTIAEACVIFKRKVKIPNTKRTFWESKCGVKFLKKSDLPF